jgi:hypothetical protein
LSKPNYKLTYLSGVTDRFRECMDMAKHEGRMSLALRSAKLIIGELETEPNTFGESRELFPAAGLVFRLAFAGPMSVYFAVHEQAKTVFIRTFNWSQRK